MTLAWLHSDCLNGYWLGADQRAVYVFDDAQLAAAGWGLKRVMFLYETLLELPVELHRGPLVATLTSFALPIVTVDTPDPWLQARIAELQRHTPVEVRPAPVFVNLPDDVDLKRFSRYWSRAEGTLLA